MAFILGTKLAMTQVFKGDKSIPVTLIESGSNFVTQIKTKENDGYDAVQVGFGQRKEKNIKKPQRGHLKKISNLNSPAYAKASAGKQISNLRYLREFSAQGGPASGWRVGDIIDISTFSVGDKVNVIAISKGKGFQGVVKRHGFHGGPKSHGQKDRHRAPGSIGSSFPEHVMKGKRMAGRMGGDRVTVKNLEVVEVDSENNLIALKGAVPGRRGTLIMIKG